MSGKGEAYKELRKSMIDVLFPRGEVERTGFKDGGKGNKF